MGSFLTISNTFKQFPDLIGSHTRLTYNGPFHNAKILQKIKGFQVKFHT
jgi:hypothetical protein